MLTDCGTTIPPKQERGLLTAYNSIHITSNVFIDDNESGLYHDYLEWLEKLAPYDRTGYRDNVGEDNADAHLKRQIMGRGVTVAVTGGRLDFGTREQIFYGEFDGRRPNPVCRYLLRLEYLISSIPTFSQ